MGYSSGYYRYLQLSLLSYKIVSKFTGGSCISWEEEPKTLEDINNNLTEHVFIKSENDQQNETFDNMIKELAKQNKRHIPMQEIALAIVQCSCEMNCNPNFNKASTVFAVQTQKRRTQVVLARESQFQSQDLQSNPIKTENIIPPTLDDEWMPDYQAKPVLNSGEVPERGVKRVLEVSPQENAKKSKPEKTTMKIKDSTGGSPKLDISVKPSCSSAATSFKVSVSVFLSNFRKNKRILMRLAVSYGFFSSEKQTASKSTFLF